MSFNFPTLNTQKREIRVLQPLSQPQPDRHDEGAHLTTNTNALPGLEMQFAHKVASLNDNPSYTALSYVWGSRECMKPITVNGQDFLITENLYSAIQHLQHADIAPAVWIDSICIDQANDVDRTEQVRLMSSIYSGATCVIIWLGLSTAKSDFIIDVVDSFVENARRQFNVPTPQKYGLIDYLDFDEESELLDFIKVAIGSVESKAPDNINPNEFIQDFFMFTCSREWWYRIWVLQEFVFARRVHFQAGNRRLNLDGFTALFGCILMLQVKSVFKRSLWNQQTLDYFGRQTGYDWISYMLVCRERAQRYRKVGTSFKMYHLLCTAYCRISFRDGDQFLLQASDKRDQIYGLVSLCKEDYYETLRMTIDYRRSWEEVYVSVAQQLISAGHLDLLAFCNTERRSCLPSWTPIWHEMIECPNGWFKSGHQNSILGNSLFSAASTIKVDVSFTISQSQSLPLRSMHITGIFVDEVMDVKSTYLRSKVTSLRDREIIYGRLFREIESLCDQSEELRPRTYTPEKLHEASWRMPIWDHEGCHYGEDEDEIHRATDRSLTRFNECLPLFKAVEEHMISEPETSEDVMQHPLVVLASKLSVDANSYLLFMEAGRPMKPFITKTGYIGLGPASMQSNDVICIFSCARVPHILRRQENDQSGYTFIGEVFVYGLMDGEVMNLCREPRKFEVF